MIYCNGNHVDKEKDACASCGEPLCDDCKSLDDYACSRTQKCGRMGEKINCEECPNRCYSSLMREKNRVVMRYAEPRMMFAHPVSAFRHLIGKIRIQRR